jgi:predicted nucleotidyltransferase
MNEKKDAEKTFGQALDEMGCKPVDLGRRIVLRERHRTNRLTRYRAPGSMAHVRHTLLSMKDDLEARGILHVWVYGSVARGDQREDSDIDLVVEINPAAGVSLTGLARLQLDLTDALQRMADLTEWHLLTDDARETARKDVVEIF